MLLFYINKILLYGISVKKIKIVIIPMNITNITNYINN